jgi:SAM-dependent methyltransferase
MTALPWSDIWRRLTAVRFSPLAMRRMLLTGRIAEGVCAARTVAATRATGLFEALRQGARTPQVLAQELNVPQNRLRVVLDAGLYFGILRKRRGGLTLTGLGREFADARDPLYASALAYCEASVGGGEQLAARLGDGHSRTRDFYKNIGRSDGASIKEYGTYMARTAAAPAQTLAAAWDLAKARLLCDVGGGFGVFSAALAARNPHLETIVVDLDVVKPVTEAWLYREGAKRVRFQALDFLHEPLPGACDAVLFARVLHDWDRTTVERLLAGAREALAPGGRLAVFEVLRHRDLGNPVPVVLAAWEIAMGMPGEIRSAQDYRALLTAAGFHDIRVERPFDPAGWNSLITART